MSPSSWRYRRREPTDPGYFSTAGSFPSALGPRVVPGEVSGYYFDFGFKAETPSFPPDWLPPRERQFHVETAQWGVGCYERFLGGEGDVWLDAARATADYLIDIQQAGGSMDGAWIHQLPMIHTYDLKPPWISAMAQGECASLLVRVHLATREDRYAEAAIRGLRAGSIPSREGGAMALLGGVPFPEEYPTEPPSFVLNGGIFGLWGFHDVGLGLGEEWASRTFEDGVDALAANIHRWDTGSWSLYDLFPHPVPNVASSAYHRIHITQLRGVQLIAPRPELAEAAERWERYSRAPLAAGRVFARKAEFRIVVARTQSIAHKLPWSHARRGRSGRGREPLVLCYHAVSPDWPSTLAVSPEQLRRQLTSLVRKGYRGVTFAEAARGGATGRTMAVTFDDGFRSVLEHGFPVLAELGLPGTIFVPTDHVGAPGPMAWPGIEQWVGGAHEHELTCLGWEGLRRLRGAGWEVGSHTRSHPRLPELDDEQLTSELAGSRRAIEEEMGEPCLTLAYPYGAFDGRVEEATRDAGYAAAATMSPDTAGAFAWPRVGVYPVDRPARFRIKTSPVVRRARSSSLGSLIERMR